METNQDIFKKITKPEERHQLLMDLAQSHAEILGKGTTDAIFRFKAMSFENSKLVCTILKTSSSMTMTQESLIANFSLGGDKYFFQGVAQLVPPTKSGDPLTVSFTMTMDIFHLQRRQNYRVKVPESYRGKFEILEINKQAVKISGRLEDLSSGGCRVLYTKSSPLKIGDSLRAQVVVGGRDPIDVKASVRHMNPDEQKKEAQVFGMEFEALNTALENRMFAITMELHREMFSRLK